MLTYEDLQREKSVWALYKTSWKFKPNAFNLLTATASTIPVVWYLFLTWPDPIPVLKLARAIVGLGVSLAPSILGFLIAGFTIFVTVTRVEIFSEMANYAKDESDESYLKYAFLGFMVVFIHYLSYLFIVVLLLMLGTEKGVFYGICKFMYDQGFKSYIASALVISTVTLSFWTIYLVLLLKSFVFNTYEIITTIVALEMSKPNNSKEEKLRHIRTMLDENKITKEEYLAKGSKIMKDSD